MNRQCSRPQLSLIQFGLAILAAWLIFISTTGFLIAQTGDLLEAQQQIYDIIDRTSPAVVEIHRRGAVFSGVIVSPNGHVLTSGHTVVPGERYAVMLPDGRRLTGHSLGACEQMRGERIDCGLIRIADHQDLPFIPLGNSSVLSAQQPCLSISYPGGQRSSNQPIVRLGYIQRPARQGRMLQSTALMEPGDSGGPLIDLSGKVIGIHSRIGNRVDQNYDMPVSAFRKYWDALNVVQQFSSANGQVIPKLGFVGRDLPEGNGIAIQSVAKGSIASELGLQIDDVLTRIQDKNLTGLRDLQPHLLSAIESESEQVVLGVRRGPAEIEYRLPSQRLIFPSAEKIPGLDSEADSEPAELLQGLADIVEQYQASLSKRLAAVCCAVTSHIDGQQVSVVATRIANSRYLVSKSSQVGSVPFLRVGDQLTELQVVARDTGNDLLLLKAPHAIADGVDVRPEVATQSTSSLRVRQGHLLFSALPVSQGIVSIVGSSQFLSPRQESRGFLGVVLKEADPQGVELAEVDEGAAKRAGLMVGDVIVAFDQQPIRRRNDMYQLLQSRDPNSQVVVSVQRNTQHFDATITLGSRPNESDHAADMMNKSLRRDGFPAVFCHDATLEPDECGGPVFDLEGNWVGLNIARYSRVRTFAIPADVVADFVRRCRDE